MCKLSQLSVLMFKHAMKLETCPELQSPRVISGTLQYSWRKAGEIWLTLWSMTGLLAGFGVNNSAVYV